jgi:hypothetical protein
VELRLALALQNIGTLPEATIGLQQVGPQVLVEHQRLTTSRLLKTRLFLSLQALEQAQRPPSTQPTTLAQLICLPVPATP